MSSTTPWRTNSLANSLHVQAVRLRPASSGNWHASFTSAMATGGGKSGRPPTPCLVLESVQTFLAEALCPSAHDASFKAGAPRHLGDGHPVRQPENHPGPHDIGEGRLHLGRQRLQ